MTEPNQTNTELTDAQLKEMQARADKADPAPWLAHGTKDDEGISYTRGWIIWTSGKWYDGQDEIASADSKGVGGGFDKGEFAPAETDDDGQNSNAEFAAHARTDVPLLIAEVRRLRTAHNDLLAACEGLLSSAQAARNYLVNAPELRYTNEKNLPIESLYFAIRNALPVVKQAHKTNE